MKKFFQVNGNWDLTIYPSVGGQVNSQGIFMKNNYIYYVEEDKMRNIQLGTNGSDIVSQVMYFGTSAFNTLDDPIPVNSVIDSIYSGTTDATWYLVSAIASGSESLEFRNMLTWYGTTNYVVAGSAQAVIKNLYLQPFKDLKIKIESNTYKFDRNESSDHRWKLQ